MYEERKEKFSFKSFFLTLLLVLLFIFLMLWIFPNKWDLDKKYNSSTFSYDEIFANNITRMKDAAIGYFTNERMPEKIGETKKLTLQEMYDLHLVLKMKDKDGNACDVTCSYVEMTKFTEEYRLKVNLSCGNYEDYIIVYLGCYSYCENGICEKINAVPSDKTREEEIKYDKQEEKYSCKVVNDKFYDKDGNVVSENEYKKSCTVPSPSPISKNYEYEYKLVKEDCKTCSEWSSWQKESISSSDNIEVETKKEKEIVEYEEKIVQTGIKIDKITKEVTEKYISGYSTRLVKVGSKEVVVGTTTKEITEEVTVKKEAPTGQIESGSVLPDSSKLFKILSTNTIPASCSSCVDETIYTWEYYEVKDVIDVVTRTEEVPITRVIDEYEQREVPIYKYRTVEKVEEVKTPVYETVKVPVFDFVVYYRFKTCNIETGFTDIKWSNTKIDSNLISKGYKLTGNVKEA